MLYENGRVAQVLAETFEELAQAMAPTRRKIRVSEACEGDDHLLCNIVLTAATSSDPYKPKVEICGCDCHRLDVQDAIASYKRMIAELKDA